MLKEKITKFLGSADLPVRLAIFFGTSILVGISLGLELAFFSLVLLLALVLEFIWLLSRAGFLTSGSKSKRALNVTWQVVALPVASLLVMGISLSAVETAFFPDRQQSSSSSEESSEQAFGEDNEPSSEQESTSEEDDSEQNSQDPAGSDGGDSANDASQEDDASSAGTSSGGLVDRTGFDQSLSLLRVSAEVTSGYDRDLFRHWVDADGDGCDARREVLIQESLTNVRVGSNCSLSGGSWYSAFDGQTTTNSSNFDVDHMVPLSEAWKSGANEWDSATRRAFANDLDYEYSLIAVSAGSNRSKGDKDPASWMPPNEDYKCAYVYTWMQVKIRWDLAVDSDEKSALERYSSGCDLNKLDLALEVDPASLSFSDTEDAVDSTPPPSSSNDSGGNSNEASIEDENEEQPAQPAPSSCGPGTVDINTASYEDLLQIIHIGPTRAEEIINTRSISPFKSVDGLDSIKGIGAGRLTDIKQEGIACVR